MQANQEGLKLNGAHQLLVCADNLLGKNLNTEEKHTSFIIKEVGLELNTDKACLCSCFINRTPGQNLNIKIGNKSLKNMAMFKYLGNDMKELRAG